jgi:hypothetical protein
VGARRASRSKRGTIKIKIMRSINAGERSIKRVVFMGRGSGEKGYR